MELLKRSEVAKFLKVHPTTVDNLVKKGKLTKLKADNTMSTTRYDAKEVNRLFKKSNSN
jgi:Helix-turn-helix domain